MSHDHAHSYVKACLNLHAVLKNLEDLVIFDPEAAAIVKEWDISIQFSVLAGPKAWISFKDGKCRVEAGEKTGPTVRLFFVGSAHLNKMMDGKGFPIPLKGFANLGFLSKDFAKVTERLEYFLKPTDALLAAPDYLAMNTRLSLNIAAYAIKEIGLNDDTGKLVAGRVPNGTVVMKILPEGPAVHIEFKDGDIIPGKGEVNHPQACMLMKDMAVANAFMNNKMDTFSAIATGEVEIRGQIPMLDALSLILDRIPVYLA
ncbi:MAG: hypothetical protein M0Z56_05680 [Desulfobacteraceae bacterium]|nr:hypothetical protein [Desulfobacteraceae bacterium]